MRDNDFVIDSPNCRLFELTMRSSMNWEQRKQGIKYRSYCWQVTLSNTLQFHFLLAFNKCIWIIFSQLYLSRFYLFLLGEVASRLINCPHIRCGDSWLKIVLKHLLSMNKNSECKSYQVFSKMLKRICVKNWSIDLSFQYIWLKPVYAILFSIFKISCRYQSNF